MFADLHCHPVLKSFLFDYDLTKDHKTSREFNPLTMRVDIPKLIKGNVKLILSSVHLPERKILTNCRAAKDIFNLVKFFYKDIEDKFEKNNYPSEPFDQTISILNNFSQKIKDANHEAKLIKIVKSKSDLEESLKENKITVVQTLEGAHSLGKDLSNENEYLDHLEKLFEEGIASITLAHFFPNDIVNTIGGIPPTISKIGGCKSSLNPEIGLTEIGKKVIEKMLQLGMLVDLTHSNLKARKEIFEINKKYNRPLIFSHVGVRKFFDHPMNPDDEEILQVKKCSGLIGIILSNYWFAGKEESFIGIIPDNGIEKIIDTVGHIYNITKSFDNIAIGSDFDGFTDPPDDLENISKFNYLFERLSEKFPEQAVKKIMYHNTLRVLKEGWGR